VSRTDYITVSEACQERVLTRVSTCSRQESNGKSWRLNSRALCVIIDPSKVLCSRAAEVPLPVDPMARLRKATMTDPYRVKRGGMSRTEVGKNAL